MTVARTVYCNGPGCNVHQGPHPKPVPFRGWLHVIEGDTEPATFDFCTWECAMRYAATLPAPEVLDFGGDAA